MECTDNFSQNGPTLTQLTTHAAQSVYPRCLWNSPGVRTRSVQKPTGSLALTKVSLPPSSHTHKMLIPPVREHKTFMNETYVLWHASNYYWLATCWFGLRRIDKTSARPTRCSRRASQWLGGDTLQRARHRCSGSATPNGSTNCINSGVNPSCPIHSTTRRATAIFLSSCWLDSGSGSNRSSA